MKASLLSAYGPWAVVTGATSGIGRELAYELARNHFSLLLHGRDTTRLIEVSKQCKTLGAIEIRTIQADLAESAGIQSVLDACTGLDVGLLIASAGFGTSGPFHSSALDHELAMVRVNAEAVVALVHRFANRFIARKRGGIILLSSLVAFQGVPNSAHYAATKAFIQSFGEGIAVELKPFGVDVLCAAPGPVASGFGSRANMRMEGAMPAADIAKPILSALGRKTTVHPGWLTKVLTYSLKTVPRWAKIRILTQVMRGMTAHH